MEFKVNSLNGCCKYFLSYATRGGRGAMEPRYSNEQFFESSSHSCSPSHSPPPSLSPVVDALNSRMAAMLSESPRVSPIGSPLVDEGGNLRVVYSEDSMAARIEIERRRSVSPSYHNLTSIIYIYIYISNMHEQRAD